MVDKWRYGRGGGRRNGTWKNRRSRESRREGEWGGGGRTWGTEGEKNEEEVRLQKKTGEIEQMGRNTVK
jgi:hypothetical protein